MNRVRKGISAQSLSRWWLVKQNIMAFHIAITTQQHPAGFRYCCSSSSQQLVGISGTSSGGSAIQYQYRCFVTSSATHRQSAPPTSSKTTDCSSSSRIGNVDVVATADTFSQGRVANVVRRLKDQSSRNTGNQEVVLERLLIDSDDAVLLSLPAAGGSSAAAAAVHLWRCTTAYSIYVPNHLSDSDGAGAGAPFMLLEFTAVGLSRDERLATQAAAMHAERLLDFYGVHMYALPRMQEKHAKAARAQKRWAPLPEEGRDNAPPSAVSPLPVLIPGTAPVVIPAFAGAGSSTGKPKRLNPFSSPACDGTMMKPSFSVIGGTKDTALDRTYSKLRAQQYDATWRSSPLLPLLRSLSSSSHNPPTDHAPADLNSTSHDAFDDRVSSCNVFRNTDDYKSNVEDEAVHRRQWSSSAATGEGGTPHRPSSSSNLPSTPSTSSSPTELLIAFHHVTEAIDPDDVTIVDDNDDARREEDVNGMHDAPSPPTPAEAVMPPTAKHRMMTSTASVAAANTLLTQESSLPSPSAFELVEDDLRFELEKLPNLVCLRDQHAASRLSDACSATFSALMKDANNDVDANTIPSCCGDVRKGMLLSTINMLHDEHVAEYEVPVLLLTMGAAILQSAEISQVWSRMTLQDRHICVDQWASSSRRADTHNARDSSGTTLLTAKGVGPTKDVAEDLCAMHAERLLEQLGVSLFAGCGDAKRDAMLHDACLRYGRRRSPSLLSKYELEMTLPGVLKSTSSSTSVMSHSCVEVDAILRVASAVEQLTRNRLERLGRTLQRPLKSYPRRNDVAVHSTHNKIARKKEALSMHGILLQLNRAIINSQRIHVLEVDFDDHQDWLIEAEEDLRNYFIEQNKARQFKNKRRSSGILPLEAELCFVNFTYTEDSQYRCSVFLPVPKEFGIRGGYAIGVSAAGARRLCAFHALDVLCAIGVPVYQDPQRQATFLAKRVQRGLVVPAATPLHDVRSPPGYRECPGQATTNIPPASTVWRVMMTDVAEFDVVRSVEQHYTTSSTQQQQQQQASSSAATIKKFSGGIVAQKPMSPYGKHDEISVLRDLAFRTLERHGITHKRRLTATSVLASDQHLGHRRRLPANNMWLLLSARDILRASERIKRLSSSTTTTTVDAGENVAAAQQFPPTIVAWGRCVHRKGSERAMLIHLIRLLLALKIDVAGSVPNGAAAVKAFLEVHGRVEDNRGVDQPSPTQRKSFVQGGNGNERNIDYEPLPCPVMTSELAVRTFV